MPVHSHYRLCDIKFAAVDATRNLSNISTSKVTGDLDRKSLSDAMRVTYMNDAIVKSWKEKAGAPLPS